MHALLLSLAMIPAAPVPKTTDADRDAALKILIECMDSDSEYVRERAIRSMAALRYRKAILELQKLLDDPQPTFRLKAIAALIELNAVDELLLKQLAELEKIETIEATQPVGRQVTFHEIYAKCAEHPEYPTRLVPFLQNRHRMMLSTGECSTRLDAAYAPHAFSVPGELEATLKRLRSYRQSTLTPSQLNDLIFFATALRHTAYPPKGAIVELERWARFGSNAWSLTLFETILQFDATNAVVAESLEMNCRYFTSDNAMSHFSLPPILSLAKDHPKAVARCAEIAFDIGTKDTRALMLSQKLIETLGCLGPSAFPYIDQLIRFAKFPETKIAALGALVRLKPELREKYLPELMDAIGREEFRGDIEPFHRLESITVSSPKWIARLEKALVDWPAEDARKQAAAKTLAAIDPENPILLKWLGGRLAAWKNQSSDVPGVERTSLMAIVKILGPKARPLTPRLLDVLREEDLKLPDPDVAAAIAAATR